MACPTYESSVMENRLFHRTPRCSMSTANICSSEKDGACQTSDKGAEYDPPLPLGWCGCTRIVVCSTHGVGWSVQLCVGTNQISFNRPTSIVVARLRLDVATRSWGHGKDNHDRLAFASKNNDDGHARPKSSQPVGIDRLVPGGLLEKIVKNGRCLG